MKVKDTTDVALLFAGFPYIFELRFPSKRVARCFSQRGEAANAGLGGRLRELMVLKHWQEQLGRLCDTSWCYWLRELLPTLLSPSLGQGLPPLVKALAEPLRKLTGHTRQEFLKELREGLESALLQPLCARVEEDLRLLVRRGLTFEGHLEWGES